METKLPKLLPPNSLISNAVSDFLNSKEEKFIKIWHNQLKEKSYSASYFLRTYDKMPDNEQLALSLCNGSILDIGAGAGAHTSYLISKKHDVTSLESDTGFAEILRKVKNSKVIQEDFFNYSSEEKFQTILLLMNGLGIAQSAALLPIMFDKLKSLLADNGSIIVEITDYKYSPEYDPSTMSDPEVTYRVMYKGSFSEEFLWLYPNLEMVSAECKRLNLKHQLIYEEDETLLLEIKKQ